MNTPVLLFLLCAAARICGNQDFSNSANLESVTTFYDCSASSDASIPPDLKDTVCDGAKPITVIRYIARPGENDIAADRGMAFYTFPQPFEEQPINQQTGPPSDNPCAQSGATTPCSEWKSGNETGPIIIQVTASNSVRKYYLKPVLDGIQVPYSYLNYDAKVPRCPKSKNLCHNKCAEGFGTTGPFSPNCDPGAGGNTLSSFYACCSVTNDFYPEMCQNGALGSTDKNGDIYNQINSFYDFGDNCGDEDADLLYNFGQDYGGLSTKSLDCRACSKTYGLKDKKEVANIGILWKDDSSSNDVIYSGCPTFDDSTPEANYMALPTNDYPRLMPDLCPIGSSHSAAYPVTEADRNSYQHGNADAYAMEPYYYWCQSMCVGSESYTPKRIKLKDDSESGKSNQCGGTVGNGGAVYSDNQIIFSQRGQIGTPDQDYEDHWLQGYSCQVLGEACPAKIWAVSVDVGGYPCCNSTFKNTGNDMGTFENVCGTTTSVIPNNCGGVAAAQVDNAASYLTAACDAGESGEIIQNYATPQSKYGATDSNGWKCPGWPTDYIRPSFSSNPLYPVSANPGLAVAKCSGECQSDPFIRWSETKSNSECKGSGSDKECTVAIETVTSQKATIGMSGAACRVYQVVPEPIVDISLVITYTAPNGEVKTSRLSTDGTSVSEDTVELQGANFTTRINQLFVRGGAGYQIPGYIVICGTDEDVGTDTCGANNYNPYDDPRFEASDGDISVPKPHAATTEAAPNLCTTNSKGLGKLRGVFPETNAAGDVVTGATKNPWPQLIRKMVQSRTLNTQASAAEKEGGDFFFSAQQEANMCHVPSPKYLGVLNCGRPAFWYYVSPERKSSYGRGCGQVGIHNSFPLSEGGRRQMCLQEDNSCTPGYGIPKFTASNAPFFRTPCQELGDYIKTTFPDIDDSGNIIPCTGENIPLGLRLPGFNYIPGSAYDMDGAGTMVPNTWVDGDFLYQDMTTQQQQNIEVDMTTYTDTFFGGNFQTYSPGKLLVDSNKTNICSATTNTETGVLTVDVLNTNAVDGGSYAVTVACFDPVSNDPLNPVSKNNGITTGGTSTVLVDLGPLQQKPLTWNIYAIGIAPPPPTPGPTPAPTTTPTPAGTTPPAPLIDIGLPNCVITLFPSNSEAELDKVTVDCTLYGLQVLVNDKITVVNDVITYRETCADWFFLTRPFCFLGNEGPYLTFMIVFLIVVGAVMMWWVVSLVTRMYFLQIKVTGQVKELKIDLAQRAQYKNEQQALLIQKVVAANLPKTPPT